MYRLISFNLSGSSLSTQSRPSFKIASFPVSVGSSFLLKTLLRVSLKRKSSAVSSRQIGGVYQKGLFPCWKKFLLPALRLWCLRR